MTHSLSTSPWIHISINRAINFISSHFILNPHAAWRAGRPNQSSPYLAVPNSTSRCDDQPFDSSNHPHGKPQYDEPDEKLCRDFASASPLSVRGAVADEVFLPLSFEDHQLAFFGCCCC